MDQVGKFRSALVFRSLAEFAAASHTRGDIVALRIDDLLVNLARSKLAQERWD